MQSIRHRLCSAALAVLFVSTVQRCAATVTLVKNSSSSWTVSNGALTLNFNPGASDITSITLSGHTDNILDPSNSKLYDELAKSGLNSGTLSSGDTLTSSYADFWTNTQSSTTNPFTYQIHYVLFNNDPAIHMYEVVNHSASDVAGTYVQGQFLMRVNPAQFPNTYQFNLSPSELGAKTTTVPNYVGVSTITSNTGRAVQDATVDLAGTTFSGDQGSTFYTKYDYASTEQFHQAHLEYGGTYSVASILPSEETLGNGPTKNDLMFTNNILMSEFLSAHLGGGSTNTGYTPALGVNTSRLFGPYAFRIAPTNSESGSQLYQDAVNTIPAYKTLYDSESVLTASGYVPTNQRGSINFSVSNSAGWQTDTTKNTVVLSDPQKSFQASSLGYQYWTQLSSSGTANISNVIPGTYRVSLYELGQWGETRYDNVQVRGGMTTLPRSVKFTPENFSASAPIWTVGTPDRSAHEFLNGHDPSTGFDYRRFHGSYNFWQEEADLGNPGKVVYYATAVGSKPATNDPNKWISNQWQTFNPGMFAGVYSSSDQTTDGYKYIAPSYVGDPSTYHGSPWEVHFTLTATQKAQGQYADLSVGLAAAEAGLTISLNGHSESWSGANFGDAMTRSGESGYYQMLVFQFPSSDLTAGGDNSITFSVNTTDGDLYDALRFEVTNASSNPIATGWHDYEWINGSTQVAADNTVGQSVVSDIVPEPGAMSCVMCAAALLLRVRMQRTSK